MNKEEVISSGGGPAGAMDPSLPPARSASTPPTPVASSAGASSPAALTNIGSIDWLGQGEGSKAGSLSCMGSQPMCTSMSASAGGSALGSSQSSCRPWERGDLLRRLATFRPANWFGKPKAASSLSCARRGWINVGIDKIECEVCCANLKFKSPDSLISTQADDAGEDFAKQLDGAHRVSCPWRGNICAESLVQFPPTPPSALIGGFKDRCDGLLQFLSLPVVAASAIEQMRISRGPQIDRFLVLAGMEMSREDAICIYTRAQKLISLCGWEPRWLPLVQDCEEHSAQSARNGCYDDPAKDSVRPQDPGPSRKAFSALSEKGFGKKRISGPESRCESRSPLLDCSLCGATVRIWSFLTVSRPARFTPTSINMPETSKKLALTRGVSAASGISGWVSTDGMEKDQTEDHDEAATTDAGLDLNLTMAGGLSSNQVHTTGISEQDPDADIGRDLVIGQPSSSEVGDRAASYESRGPSSRKRSLEEGGSTADIPHLRMQQQADSVEGTVIDRDGDEVNDGRQYSAGNLKRARDSDALDTSVAGPSRSLHFEMETNTNRDLSSYRRHSTGAGPSHSLNFDNESQGYKLDLFHKGNRQVIGAPSTRNSAHASSVIAMDTVYHGTDDDSMESVENYRADDDDVHFPSTSMFKNPDLNDTSEVNYSNQAQNSTCFQPAAVRVASEMGVSSINDGEEVLNTETATTNPWNGISFGISGGSVGMGASHEAEIHGADVSIHRVDSGVGDVEPIAEVTENQGQTGEFAPDTGLTDDFVPDEMDREDPHGDSQDLFSRSLGRADSGSKIVGFPKAESVESGDKTGPLENSAHPSLSCNAVVCSGYEASKEEVSQACKASRLDDCTSPGSGYMLADGIGPPNGESNYEEGIEFDPIKYHNIFCPWVNGNVAAAGCARTGCSSSVSAVLCGWQLTLDALDSFQSLGHDPPQTVESESTASLYKDDHLNPGRKLLAHHSFSKSRGQSWV